MVIRVVKRGSCLDVRIYIGVGNIIRIIVELVGGRLSVVCYSMGIAEILMGWEVVLIVYKGLLHTIQLVKNIRFIIIPTTRVKKNQIYNLLSAFQSSATNEFLDICSINSGL